MIWSYWNFRAYRFDPKFQRLARSLFLEGVAAGRDPTCPMDKDNLQ